MIKRPKQVERSQKSYLSNEKYQDYAEQQFKNIYDYLDEHETYEDIETKIGTWINGKTIYRKVITGYIGNNTTYQFPLNIDNIEDKWINGSSFLLTPNGISKPLNVFEIGSNYYIRTELTNTTINVMHSDTTYYSGTMYAIIEYTKTTD